MDRNLAILVFLIPSMVALRKESVDRNQLDELPKQSLLSRSPQGERG